MDVERARQVVRDFDEDSSELLERALSFLKPAVISGVVADDDRGSAGTLVDELEARLKLRRQAIEILARVA